MNNLFSKFNLWFQIRSSNYLEVVISVSSTVYHSKLVLTYYFYPHFSASHNLTEGEKIHPGKHKCSN